jgi:hypothetical protein
MRPGGRCVQRSTIGYQTSRPITSSHWLSPEIPGWIGPGFASEIVSRESLTTIWGAHGRVQHLTRGPSLLRFRKTYAATCISIACCLCRHARDEPYASVAETLQQHWLSLEPRGSCDVAEIYDQAGVARYAVKQQVHPDCANQYILAS